MRMQAELDECAALEAAERQLREQVRSWDVTFNRTDGRELKLLSEKSLRRCFVLVVSRMWLRHLHVHAGMVRDCRMHEQRATLPDTN